MTDSINWCDLKKNAKHIGEVSTSRVDGSPTGAEILTSTNEVTGQERDTLAGKLKKMDDTFDTAFWQYVYKHGGNWADAPSQITDADKLTYWEYPDNSGDGYAVKGSVTLPITKPSSPVNDSNWFIATSVNTTQMRTERFKQLDLYYGGVWSPNTVIKSQTDPSTPRPKNYALLEETSGNIIIPVVEGEFTTLATFDLDKETGNWAKITRNGSFDASDFFVDYESSDSQRIKAQSAFNYCAKNKIWLVVSGVIKCGTVAITEDGETNNICIKVPTGAYVGFTPSGMVRVIDNALAQYNILDCYGNDDITMYKPYVYGDLEHRPSTDTSEYGYGIVIQACNNVNIVNPKADYLTGDGFYVGCRWNVTSSKVNQNITLVRPTTNFCRRNGLQLGAGVNVKIKSPNNKNVGRLNGLPPSSGVNIEPEAAPTSAAKPTLQEVTITNPVSNRCNGAGLHIAMISDWLDATNNVDITITNPVDSFSKAGLSFNGNKKDFSGSVVITNPVSKFAETNGIVGGWCGVNNSISITNPVIIDNAATAQSSVSILDSSIVVFGNASNPTDNASNISITDVECYEQRQVKQTAFWIISNDSLMSAGSKFINCTFTLKKSSVKQGNAGYFNRELDNTTTYVTPNTVLTESLNDGNFKYSSITAVPSGGNININVGLHEFDFNVATFNANYVTLNLTDSFNVYLPGTGSVTALKTKKNTIQKFKTYSPQKTLLISGNVSDLESV